MTATSDTNPVTATSDTNPVTATSDTNPVTATSDTTVMTAASDTDLLMFPSDSGCAQRSLLLPAREVTGASSLDAEKSETLSMDDGSNSPILSKRPKL